MDPEIINVTSVTVVNVDVPSLLSWLRCPTSSELARKRKVKSNPPKGVKHGKGAVSVEPSVPLP